MAHWSEYLFPKSVEETLELLAAHAGRARIIAGGTDLALQAESGKCTSTVLVDITRIPGLDFCEERGGAIWIGPQVTHAQLAASPLIREKAGVLAAGCGSVGGPQIRHVATLAGNVVNAMPAADGAVALFALDAEVEVADAAGRRTLPISELYAGVGVCTLDPCVQMVTAIHFRPLAPGTGWAYKRLAQRRVLILPMLNVAVVAQVEAGRFGDVRIAVGPVAATPLRARAAEAALQGQPAGAAAIAEAARLAQEAAHPRDSAVRGSGEYRKAMVEVLVRRGLEQAVEGSGWRA
jgi:carbon-monoxide dehydrogenase medium subunit